MTRIAAVAVVAFGAGCIPLVVGPNNFTPAGEVGTRPYGAAVSVEFSRPLTIGIRPVEGVDVSKVAWFSQDLAVRVPMTQKVAFEGQFKWASLLPLLLPLPVGLSAGARATLLEQEADGFSLDVGGRALALSTDLTKGDKSLSSSALGLEAYAPVSWRAFSWLAFTGTPFARVHRVSFRLIEKDKPDQTDARLPVGLGVSVSPEFKVKSVVFAPAVAVEWFYMSGDGFRFAPPAPGLLLGARF